VAQATVANQSIEASLTGKGSGSAPDKTFRYLALASGLTVLAILGGIAFFTTNEAWPTFTHQGFGFIFSTKWQPSEHEFGGLAIIYGTVVVGIISLVLAVPVSIGIALFVTEVAPKRTRPWITTVIDLLAAVPSVVFGLWGFRVLRLKLPGFYDFIARLVRDLHLPLVDRLFKPHSTGQGFMTAGIVVALMITPIITSVTREVFLTVPRNDKDGALALGATRWEMIRNVVLPHSTGGMTGAIMLGLGRAMGETIAVALTIGGSPQIIANLFGAGDTMPAEIANKLGEADVTYRSALIGLGVVLFVLTILVNVGARRAVVVIDRRLKGAV
jgi:phosphate transport system permease protein